MLHMKVLPFALVLCGLSSPALASCPVGMNCDSDGPILPETFVSSTVTLAQSVAINGNEMSFNAVDAAGAQFSGYVNANTGEVVATNGQYVISNTLTPQQQQIAAQNYQQAVAAGIPMIIVPAIIGGGLCYANDQITKHNFIKHCESRGGRVRVENSGFCGFSASYSCDEDLPKPPDEPRPTPYPGPGPEDGAFWMSDGLFGLKPVGWTNDFSVWTYDSDFFGN